MRVLNAAAIALALALLGACGQTGPLYYPEPEQEQPQTEEE